MPVPAALRCDFASETPSGRSAGSGLVCDLDRNGGTTDPAAVLNVRRRRAAAALALRDDEILLVWAGERIGIPGGQDQTYPFVPHPEFYWLTDDRTTAGAVLAYDAAKAEWVVFRPAVTEADRLWEGTPAPMSGSSEPTLAELPAWLAARRGRAVMSLGAPPACAGLGAAAASGAVEDRYLAVRAALTHARRAKDAMEITRMRRAAAATCAGHAMARERIRAVADGRMVATSMGSRPVAPELTEQHVADEMEHAFRQAGANGLCYQTIVVTGARSAILHGHPSAEPIRPGQLVLIDAGAAVHGYGVDVTRTIACGAPTGAAREVHAIVATAFHGALRRCLPGSEWIEAHAEAALQVADGLRQMGVLKATADTAVESGAVALFFPHGVGHMVGIGARDAGGTLPGRAPRLSPGGIRLRMDLPLEIGYTVTVEPGCYFIEPLLQDRARRDRFGSDMVDWERVDGLLSERIGGVRLEDTVLITERGPERLTGSIPMELD